MTEFNYNKHKDDEPTNTLNKIQDILDKLDIKTSYEWIESDVKGCYSNRVTIDNTTLGTNGKGTNRIYALTSGYAELIERIQNNILYMGDYDKITKTYEGFNFYSDEKEQNIEEIINSDNELIKLVFDKFNCNDFTDKFNTIKKWINIYSSNNKIPSIPFISLRNRRVEYIPCELHIPIYGSNGMCAGNTLEEALVQGLAEIFERNVDRKIIEQNIVPPTIPDGYIKNCKSLWEMIQNIQSSGRYKVIVKDCSLNKNYPVIGTIIIDTHNGTFGFKLASHPVFDIALERTLTEAFQGKTLEAFTSFNSIGDQQIIYHRDNILNTMKTGQGYYHKDLLLDKYTYEFKPMPNMSNKTNKQMLKYMIDLIIKQDYDILIRDVSFLGFNSYSIIVPRFSEMYSIDEIRCREQTTLFSISNNLSNLNKADIKDLERIVKLIKFKQFSLIENQPNFFLARPFKNNLTGGLYSTQFLLSICLYKLNKFDESIAIMNSICQFARINKLDKDLSYYSCIKFFMQLKKSNTSDDDIKSLVNKLYTKEIADKVLFELGDSDKIFERLYPKFNCWDCKNCEAKNICTYEEVAKLLNKLRDEAHKNPISQQNLLEQIINL